MKKFIMLALVCALILVSLLGCGKKNDAGDGHKGLQRNYPYEQGRNINDSSNERSNKSDTAESDNLITNKGKVSDDTGKEDAAEVRPDNP